MRPNLIGTGYVSDMKTRLQAYRRKLRPRGSEGPEQLQSSLLALGETPDARASRSKLVRQLNAAIRREFTARDGRPLGKLKRAEIIALASRLQDNVDGKGRNFDPDDEDDFVQGDYLDPKQRKQRRDKGVLRKPPRAKKRAPSAYNLFVREKMAEMKDQGVPVKQRMTAIGQMWRNRGDIEAKRYEDAQAGDGHRTRRGAGPGYAARGGGWADYVPPAAKRAAVRMVERRIGAMPPQMSGYGHGYRD